MDNDDNTEIKPVVDYVKSIRKQRLVYKFRGAEIFFIIFNYVFALFFIGIASIGLFNELRMAEPSSAPLIICAFVIIWAISNKFFTGYLVKIKGKSITDNKNDMFAVTDNFISSFDFTVNNDQMMRSFKPVRSPVWGRIITILFDGDLIYLNITTLGKTNSPTWIHGLFNFIKAKRMAGFYKKHFQG